MLSEKLGHLRHACPDRKRTTSEAVKTRVIENDNDDKAIAKVLCAMTEEDEFYEEYPTMS